MERLNRVNLIFLGPPGAGKGTQAERLARRWHLKKISTGDILREAVRNNTPLGQKAREYMERGDLVPDEVMLGLIREVLQELPEGGFILDGFPRTLEQARGLDRLLQELNLQLHAVVLFEVPDEEIVRRLSARRVCPKCGATYNLITDPPKNDERCDRCGEPLVLRDDDHPDTVRHRLEVYHRQTEPLIEYYRRRDLLRTISGVGTPEEVETRLLQALQDGHSH